MQYQIPQFIEVEDKIFGPLTFKQFVYLAGGGGLCLAIFTLMPLWIGVPLMLPIIALSLALAFFEINGRPFIVALEHGLYYLIGAKLYLWKPRTVEPDKAKPATPTTGAATTVTVPRLSQSKLKDLAWSLNIKDRAVMGIQQEKPTGFEL